MVVNRFRATLPLTALLAILIPLRVQAAQEPTLTLSALAQRLKGTLTPDAAFLMERTLPAQGITLRSRGEVHRTEPNTLEWVQKTPVAQTIVFSPKGISMRVEGESPEEVTAEAGSPISGLMTALPSLLALDVASLEALFTLERLSTDESGAWELALAPKDALLVKILEHATVRGNATLEEIAFAARDGSSTHIRFTPLPRANTH